MTKDDPFGLKNDAGRTRVRPVRRGAAGASSSPVRTAAGGQDAGDPGVSPRLRESRAGNNPLINAFAPLLGLAPELERATAPDNPETLRTRLLDNLTYARDSAVSAGVPLSRADQGAWFVAALLDDIAINTPWGGASGWPRLPLVVSLYGNVDVGERYFELVEELMRHPERDPEMLELAQVCTALGFRGKYRVQGGNGEAALMQLRGQLDRLNRDPDVLDRALSPHWQGVLAEDEDRGFILPIWAIVLIASALVAAIYVGLGVRLSARGEQLYTLAAVLPPPARADIYRPVIETTQPEPVLLEPVVLELLPLVAEAAPKDKVSALTGREDVSVAVVVVQSTDPEVFRSAKSDLNVEYEELIRSIAGVITSNVEFIGTVRVVGHTDSVPVQRSNPFQSNQGLSEARARTIADLLVAAGVPADLIVSEGRAATEPIADNKTRDGRARNRRVEIILQKKV
ncbi:type IVB secretion system protein IcmH/DotU [Ruegeria marina]|uniref:Type VI secretion system protein ImpK n=1 Tax=Ruegeria marina TaxID=639004 RepID=A0A1G7CWW7_9RHOB|nr:type IVB secretion system protein IcmH/DotU [Ruegeria marina]SDE43954.1 type VI secretion system protein ImpK [Ruegeria marina]